MIRQALKHVLLNAEVITANGASSVVVSSSAFAEGLLLLRVSATGGTNFYLDLTVETAEDVDGTFQPHTYVPRVKGNGNPQAVKLTHVGNALRLSYRISGTDTPTATVTAILILKN